MKISDLTGVLRGIDPRDTLRPDAQAPRPAPEHRSSDYGDSLELSLSARLSVTSEPGPQAAAAPDGLTADRIAQLRQRIADGHYSRPEVLDETVRRVLDFYSR